MQRLIKRKEVTVLTDNETTIVRDFIENATVEQLIEFQKVLKGDKIKKSLEDIITSRMDQERKQNELGKDSN
jgi:hypothetical protein